MPFVLFLIFGTWFLLILAKDRSKQIARFNDFPSCLRQEEYLKFYELLMEYRRDTRRQDPVGDAREDAGQWIYDKGYLPYAVRNFGRSDWRSRPLTKRNGFVEFEVHERPSYRELLSLRSKDIGYGDYSMKGAFLKDYGKDIAIDTESWGAYCTEMDDWFVRINEQYNIQKYQIEQNRPTGYALEYLIACCKMFQPGSFNWERYHVRLGVLRCGYLPTSLKPRHGHKETRKCEYYVAQYPPQEETVRELLCFDQQWWHDHNCSGFAQYAREVQLLFTLAHTSPNVQFRKALNVRRAEGCLEQPDPTWRQRDFKELLWD